LVLDDLLSGLLLRVEARFAILLGCAPAHQANHCTSGRAAGFLDVDLWDVCPRAICRATHYGDHSGGDYHRI
jgi:hypothetical protein